MTASQSDALVDQLNPFSWTQDNAIFNPQAGSDAADFLSGITFRLPYIFATMNDSLTARVTCLHWRRCWAKGTRIIRWPILFSWPRHRTSTCCPIARPFESVWAITHYNAGNTIPMTRGGWPVGNWRMSVYT